MKSTAYLLLVLITVFALTPAKAQHQSKENFEHRNSKRSFFGKLLHNTKSNRGQDEEALAARQLPKSASANRLTTDPTQWNKNQRKQAEQIWQQQRDFRAKQQAKKREPTAWELAYLKQEKQREKELKKLLKEKDKQIAARAKNKQKAMASAARYNRRKARQAPVKSNTFETVFSSANDAPRADNASRKK